MMRRQIGKALLGSGGIVIATALLVTGCDSGDKEKATATSPPTSSSAPAPSSPAPATGPFTTAELTWAQGAERLLPTMNKIYSAAPTDMTGPAMLSMAKKLRTCTNELTRMGEPTPRLQPVHALLKQGCAEFEKSAKCFEEASRIGIPESGSAEDKKQSEKIKCGYAASGTGGQPLADAVVKLSAIKTAAGGS